MENVREIIALSIVGLGVGGAILTNYLIKRNRPAEFYLAQKAEAEASVEKYRIQLEHEAKENELKRGYEEREREKKRQYELTHQKLANEREAALPDAYWIYRAAIENKEARKYEADKLEQLIEALGDTSNLNGRDELVTAICVLAKRTEKDEKLILDLIELVNKFQIVAKAEDASIQVELVKKTEEVKATKDNFEKELEKLESLKHINPELDFNFDSLMHKEIL